MMPAAPARSVQTRLEIHHDLGAVEAIWRRLEADPDMVLTPYQRYDFSAAWQRHVGARNGITPLIAVGYDAGAPVCLLPLGQHQMAATRQAEFLGGKHANFNMAIWRRDYGANATTDDVEALLAPLGEAVDALILLNQPEHWNGLRNPFLNLPHSVSADPAYHGTLMPDFDALLAARMSTSKRKKLRNRERALAQHGTVTFRRAETADDANAILAAFHHQKAQRMRELGVGNVFAEPGVADFIAEAAALAPGRAPVIELYALATNDEIVATSAGVVAGGRFSTMFNSITRTATAQASPGQILLNRLVESACARGLHTFDLGVGEAQYKEIFCNDPEPLFDSFLPFSPAGRMIAAANRAAYAAKRTIKRNAMIWSTVQAARRWRTA
jgi:CelD/BcsL family acetyltransferase involved in cellulose biosynthesis